MRVGISADHAGFDLKEKIAVRLRNAGHTLVDFGAHELQPEDDYPDYVIPLGRAVASGEVQRGVAVCGSGVGASVCASKLRGVRACLIEDLFSAKQGVEDDDLNVICLGGASPDLRNSMLSLTRTHTRGMNICSTLVETRRKLWQPRQRNWTAKSRW